MFFRTTINRSNETAKKNSGLILTLFMIVVQWDIFIFPVLLFPSSSLSSSAAGRKSSSSVLRVPVGTTRRRSSKRYGTAVNILSSSADRRQIDRIRTRLVLATGRAASVGRLWQTDRRLSAGWPMSRCVPAGAAPPPGRHQRRRSNSCRC